MLDVPPHIVTAVKRCPTLEWDKSILDHNVSELMAMLKLPKGDVGLLRDSISRYLCPAPVTAGTLKTIQQANAPRLTLGCEILDDLLDGGVLAGGITEIVGESACGKTQFALQLSLMAQRARQDGGLDGAVVYVCTEDAFPHRRLQQLLATASERWGLSPAQAKRLSDRIYIEHVDSMDEKLFVLTQKLPHLLSRLDTKLVIIDSIAALFRIEYDVSQFRERADMIASFGCELNKLGQKYHIPIVCINQVTADFGDSAKGLQARTATMGQAQMVKPALGLCWANFVKTRIMLSHALVPFSANNETGCEFRKLRTAHVYFAPHLACKSCAYTIHEDGVHGVAVC